MNKFIQKLLKFGAWIKKVNPYTDDSIDSIKPELEKVSRRLKLLRDKKDRQLRHTQRTIMQLEEQAKQDSNVFLEADNLAYKIEGLME